MLKGMATGLALLLAASVTSPAAAQAPQPEQGVQLAQRGKSQPSREAARAAAAFNEAAATYAEIVELTVTDKTEAVKLRVLSARSELKRLRDRMDEEAFLKLESQVAEMEAANAKGDVTGTALAATEAFKLVVTSMDARMRQTPLEVWLHTYAAFKLVVLATASAIEWPAVGDAAKDSEKSWIALRRLVRDTNLRVLLSEIQSGLRDAVARKDAESVKFAARLQIGSIAVLRDFFARFARSMARGR